MKKMFSILGSILVFIFIGIILGVSLRGIEGNPSPETLNEVYWTDNGPFELSPERGRFALTYSLVEENSFSFSTDIARFATPDLGYVDGKYVSLFAPGLSYLIIPGYVLGKNVLLGQVGSYGTIALFALINVMLIRAIVIRLGGSNTLGLLAGMIFLFATPAFAYSVSLYQHHISTFLILFSLYLVFRFNNFISLALVWFLLAASIPIDYPNLILMFPIGIYAALQIIYGKITDNKIRVVIKPVRILSLAAVMIPLWFFIWFNQNSYGNALQFSGTVASVKAIDSDGNPVAPKTKSLEEAASLADPDSQDKSAVNFFQTRFTLNGLATHFINRDRGVIWFTPVVIIAIAGAVILYKRDKSGTSLLLSIIAANVLLYSLWGDPYGGWAFGSRYLIPSYAIAAILIAFALMKFRRNIFFLFIFIVLAMYSFSVNSIGALSTNRIPPKAEVLGLEELSGVEEKYSFDRGYQMLEANNSKSFIFQTYAKNYLTAIQYHSIISGSIAVVFLVLLTTTILQKEKKYA